MIDALRHTGLHLIECEAIADGVSVDAPDGAALLLERDGAGRLIALAAGARADVLRDARAGRAKRYDRAGCVLIPGLVNAHTHLDLTYIGPRAYDAAGGFAGWIDMVRRERVSGAEAIKSSVRAGVDLAVRGGTVLLGDIAGALGGRVSDLSTRALRDACEATGLHAVSFVEFFAQSAAWRERVDAAWGVVHALRQERTPPAGGRVIVGLQPHAPYSVHLEAYAEVIERCEQGGVPLCTHLAESPEEAELIAAGTGPFRGLLEAVGVWDAFTAEQYGHGMSPVGHMAGRLGRGMGAVHVNQASARDLDLLRDGLRDRPAPTPVAYCPRASAYFGAAERFGPHRYRQMPHLALGTDSVINIPAEHLACRGLCMIDEARMLVERDRCDARDALNWITAGAEAFLLGRAAESASSKVVRSLQSRFAPGVDLLGVVALPIGRDVLRTGDACAAARAAVMSLAEPEILTTGLLRVEHQIAVCAEE